MSELQTIDTDATPAPSDNLITLSPNGILPAPKSLTGSVESWVRKRAESLDQFVTEVRGEIAKVESDRKMHPAVKADRKLQVLAKASQELEVRAGLSTGGLSARTVLEQERDKFARRLEAGQRLYWDFSQGDPVHGAARPSAKDESALKREIRDRLMALKPEQRLPIAMDAAKRNDLVTLRAIHEAPGSFRVLYDEQWRQVDDAHRRQHHAAEVADLEQRQRALNHLHFNAIQARKALGLEAADTEPVVVGEHGFEE